VFGGALVALAAVFSLNEEGLMPEDATRGKAVPGTEPTPEARAASAAKWIANWRSKVSALHRESLFFFHLRLDGHTPCYISVSG
jgi:hypothetical protein